MNIVIDEVIYSDSWCVCYRIELEDKYNCRLLIIIELKCVLVS